MSPQYNQFHLTEHKIENIMFKICACQKVQNQKVAINHLSLCSIEDVNVEVLWSLCVILNQKATAMSNSRVLKLKYTSDGYSV